MRRVKVFSGSSHPLLTESICERLGIQLGQCDLRKYSNGETSVNINTSIRDQDVFIVQSGSRQINDSVMELLIMISACKGGSARSITAVMPYFPYSRQSKKKSHRGAITARMLANLLSVAGIHHVITVDLHASPMQGFFGKPVDNLHAEPIIARWIRNHVAEWKEAVVVSKNPGGTKRVTSLADALKLNFAIVTTDRRRLRANGTMLLEANMVLPQREGADKGVPVNASTGQKEEVKAGSAIQKKEDSEYRHQAHSRFDGAPPTTEAQNHAGGSAGTTALPQPLQIDAQATQSSTRHARQPSNNSALPHPPESNESGDEFTDERARDVITGRLVQGHIVDDDFPSPVLSTISGPIATPSAELIGPPHFDERDLMTASFLSTVSSHATDQALGGSYDAAASSDEEEASFKNAEVEQTITLVGNVRERVVFIIDDMMDRSGSWIAAAETVVKRGGAKKVYCIATHGLFGDSSFEDMEACVYIDHIVVTNTFPISQEKIRTSKKLVVLDLSSLLAEAIRRNHYGESLSQLYQNYAD